MAKNSFFGKKKKIGQPTQHNFDASKAQVRRSKCKNLISNKIERKCLEHKFALIY